MLAFFPRLCCILFLITSGISPLADAAATTVASTQRTPRILRDLSYVTAGHARQKLDLYLPQPGAADVAPPLVVWIHGGGWLSGTKADPPTLFLLERGFAIASVGYRYSTEARFPAQVHDCKAAIRWLRANASQYGYDSQRIAAWGASAGGHLAALLVTTGHTRKFDVGENLDQASTIECAIDFFGPTDLPGWQPPSEDPRIQRGGSKSLFVRLLGGSIDEQPGLAREASPITWVQEGGRFAPLLVVHGTRDPLVGLEQSRGLVERLREVKAEASLEVIEGAGHGGSEFTARPCQQNIHKFLERHLRWQESGGVEP